MLSVSPRLCSVSAISRGTFVFSRSSSARSKYVCASEILPFGQIDGADVVQRERLAAPIALLPHASAALRAAAAARRRAGRGFIEQRGEVDERMLDAGLVADLALQLQGLLVALFGLLRLAVQVSWTCAISPRLTAIPRLFPIAA